MSLYSNDVLEHQSPKKIMVALNTDFLKTIDLVAYVEHRTRTDLIREALRRYIENFRRQQKELTT